MDCTSDNNQDPCSVPMYVHANNQGHMTVFLMPDWVGILEPTSFINRVEWLFYVDKY